MIAGIKGLVYLGETKREVKSILIATIWRLI